MIQTRDTFMHFLADNLTNVTLNGTIYPIVVKNVRRDTSNPASEELQINAINVKFLNTDYDEYVSNLTTSIDVIYTDELVAAVVTEALFTLLRQAAYTPKMNYRDSSYTTTPYGGLPDYGVGGDYGGENVPAPFSLGYTVFWEPSIKFKPIKTSLYFHYHARLILSQHQ